MSILDKLAGMSDTGEILIGVAPIERFEGLAPAAHPASILPGAQSVIVTATEIPRGDYRGLEEGTVWGPASRWDYAKPLKVAEIVEREGYNCVPYVPSADAAMPGKPVREGAVAPNVGILVEYAAVAAGLGEIGYCGLFMTRQFGIRQSLGLAITDAPLPGTPIHMEPICTKCKKCASLCPLGALSATQSMTLTIMGKKMESALSMKTPAGLPQRRIHRRSSCRAGALPQDQQNNQLVSFSQLVSGLSSSTGRGCSAAPASPHSARGHAPLQPCFPGACALGLRPEKWRLRWLQGAGQAIRSHVGRGPRGHRQYRALCRCAAWTHPVRYILRRGR